MTGTQDASVAEVAEVAAEVAGEDVQNVEDVGESIEAVGAAALAVIERLYDEAMAHIALRAQGWQSSDVLVSEVSAEQVASFEPEEAATGEIPRQAA